MAAQKRIFRDIVEIEGDESLGRDYGISLDRDVEEDQRHFHAYIQGPPDSPYHRGTFKLLVRIPPRFPFAPPKIKFETRIFHPNICSSSGQICLDVLELPKWKSPMTLKIALMSVYSLLSSPNPESPQDFTAGTMCEEDLEMFNRSAKMWTYIHAGGPSCVREYHTMMCSLEKLELELSKEKQLDLLTACQWNLSEAVNKALDASNASSNLNLYG